MAAEVLFAPGRIYQTAAYGILSYDQCRTHANLPDGFCSSTGGVTLLPNLGLRLTWLFL